MPAPLALVLLALALALGPAVPAPAQQEGTERGGPRLAGSIEDPATLLRLAESALAARRLAEASDLIERAEARLLTRGEPGTAGERAVSGGALGDLAAAREALGRRDQAGAAARLAAAVRRLGSEPVQPSAAPPPAPGPAFPPLPGIAPQNLPVGGSASPPVPIGEDAEILKDPPPPGAIPPASTKLPSGR